MNSDVRPHEKIRFKRSDIASLDRLPSAVAAAPVRSRRARFRRTFMIAFLAAAGVACLIVVTVGALIVGVGDERLRQEAQGIVARMAGDQFQPSIGGTDLSLSGLDALGLEVNDLRLFASDSQEEAVRVGTVRFGLSFLPLARGQVQVGRVAVEDARVVVSSLPRQGDGINFNPLLNDDGQIEPDALIAAVFDGAEQFITLLHERAVDRVDISDVEVVLPSLGGVETLHLTNARLTRRSTQSANLDAEFSFDGREGQVRGEFERDASTGRIKTLSFAVDIPQEEAVARADGLPPNHIGFLNLSLAGSQVEGRDRLSLSAQLGGADFAIGGRGQRLTGDVSLQATLLDGAGKIEIDGLAIGTGRTAVKLHGAIGPAPQPDQGYRFELVSDGSTIAPFGLYEQPMSAVAMAAGHVALSMREVHADEIRLRTGQGEATASISLRFEPGLVPGFSLRVDTDGIPVAQAKQLWPWFAAPPARDWVMANIYGGRVESGFLQIDIAPGRIGDGIPLSSEEIRGEFHLRGTRFDIAGHMPPVRDGNGSVNFNGKDIAIALESGTVFMPGGRTVDASNGNLIIDDFRRRPVIGKLDIDVSGSADAIFQLATYDPIGISRFIDLSSDELSGEVSGKVVADIPFQREIPIETLDWKVDLAYEGLALSRPFEGQTVSAAKGTIVIDPRRAMIDATAQLNGAPATIKLLEPLGREKSGRERQISLQMDDAARRKLAPGLDTLLSGPMQVELQETQGEARTIRASLQNAALSIPWIGWSKGAGVPGTVAFRMDTDGNRTDLSDFRLNGETFGATGALSLVGGDVSRIRFSSARLNRGDDFSFDLNRQGRGYAITVRGNSVDVRSLVKLMGKETEAGTSATAAVPISLDVSVDAMVGFHGEILRDVKLSYAGSGARTDSLEFSAVTAAGKRVTGRDGRDGDVRNVSMRSSDAGALLRFLDIYENVQGGDITMSLRGTGAGPLSGQVDTRDFWVVNEARLRSLVSTPSSGDGRSLNQAVRGELDTTRVYFERAFSLVEKGDGYLNLQRGVLRGPAIGSTFQGMLYDTAGNMDMTGTFMPAYGLNRLFGEIPLIGQILGNGRDRGLIGITFRLAGKAGEPQLQINPLSVIAPGIFRSVFEFR